jgi:hypothetical protein
MSNLDFTKPIYHTVCYDCSYLTNSYDEALKRASLSAQQDRSGDDYLVTQAIKRVSTPRPDATITDVPTA